MSISVDLCYFCWFLLTSADFNSFQLFLIDLGWLLLSSVDFCWLPLVSVDFCCFLLTPILIAFGWCLLISFDLLLTSADLYCSRLISVDSGRSLIIHVAFCWLLLISVGPVGLYGFLLPSVDFCWLLLPYVEYCCLPAFGWFLLIFIDFRWFLLISVGF